MVVVAMSVVSVVTTPIPEDDENAIVEQIRKRAKWDNDDYVFRSLILKDQLWKQYKELFGILGRFTQHKTNMDEAIQVSCISDKLPSSWKDFKHKKQELTLVELGSHLRIEESLWVQDSDKPNGKNVVVHSDWTWTDRGGEYMDTLYFQSAGIIHETNAPYTPQQNAMLTTCYLLNRVLNKRNMITPYELWTKRKPNLNYLKVWGYRAVVRLLDPKLKTLGERGIECIFVGYAKHSKAFRFYVIEPNEPVIINSIIESRDAIFDKNKLSSVLRPRLKIPSGTEDVGDSVSTEKVTEEVVQQPELELRKSKRNRTLKDFGPEF
ncbi:zinc finger, CCHC-type containing protein [Tanacetum coccineum]